MHYNLIRFINAHNTYYKDALLQIKKGQKTSHWIWFIFPQIKGLGKSQKSILYSISSIEEARDFYNHPILGRNLKEISRELLQHNKESILKIIGSFLDAKKVCSSMTLFYIATKDPLFKEIIDTFFFNTFDYTTLALLNKAKP